MSMSSLLIRSSGLFTTVQDIGRYGFQRYGMPVAGAMDAFSFQLANALVGNLPNDACLEITLIGPEIEFLADSIFAICGADMNPCINSNPVPIHKTIAAKKGDVLSFSGLKAGCRSYIAFAGGIQVPMVMGSRSTYLRGKVGGFEGRALKSADVVPLGSMLRNPVFKEIPDDLLPQYSSSQILQITPGPEINRFDIQGITALLTSEYRIADQSDRMGYRLSGEEIKQAKGSADIISAGISMGTIQIPGNGQPIILMADRQTTGGYTRIAHVASVDLTLLAQLKPGDRIRFKEITLGKAQELIISRQKRVEKWNASNRD